jgi:hypothetical protein
MDNQTESYKQKRKQSNRRFFSYVLPIIGCLLFLIGLTDLYYSSSVKTVNGTLKNYSFYDGYRVHQYYIYINEYSRPFQIPASLIPYFKVEDFKRLMKYNNPLSLTYYFKPGFMFIEQRNILFSVNGLLPSGTNKSNYQGDYYFSFMNESTANNVFQQDIYYAFIGSAIFIFFGLYYRHEYNKRRLTSASS